MLKGIFIKLKYTVKTMGIKVGSGWSKFESITEVKYPVSCPGH